MQHGEVGPKHIVTTHVFETCEEHVGGFPKRRHIPKEMRKIMNYKVYN
jgi:hypothetical protein